MAEGWVVGMSFDTVRWGDTGLAQHERGCAEDWIPAEDAGVTEADRARRLGSSGMWFDAVPLGKLRAGSVGTQAPGAEEAG